MSKREAVRMITIVGISGALGIILVRWIGSSSTVRDEGEDRPVDQYWKLEPFRQHLHEYDGIVEGSNGQSSARGREGIRGGVVTIRKTEIDHFNQYETLSVSPIFIDLKGDLEPQSPSDVRTIILIDCVRKIYGDYISERDGSEKGTAYRAHCILTAADRKTAAKMAMTELEGPLPPPKIEDGGHERYGGDVDDEAILKWIADLDQAR